MITVAHLEYLKNKLDELTNWGDFHRLLAARFTSNNYTVTEVQINHFHRVHGFSNYSFNRIAYVIWTYYILNYLKIINQINIFIWSFCLISILLL